MSLEQKMHIKPPRLGVWSTRYSWEGSWAQAVFRGSCPIVGHDGRGANGPLRGGRNGNLDLEPRHPENLWVGFARS